MIFKSIKKFIERGHKGYCYEDLWSFDSWLSKPIANGLREFKAKCRGYPNDIDDFDEWLKILDEMIDCFEEQTRSPENLSGSNLMERWRKRKEHKAERLHRGLQLLEKYYFDLWD